MKRITLISVIRFSVFIFIFISPFAVSAESSSVSSDKKNISPQVQDIKQPLVAAKDKTSESNPAKGNPSDAKAFQDKALENIQSIAQTGALHLALLNLDKQQVAYKDDPMRWLIWERERIRLLNLTKQYVVLVKRLTAIPKDINESFLYWAKTQQASAYLKLQDYAKARQVLSSVIWSRQHHDSEFTNRWLPHWRRMVIHSYLSERLFKDALIAITRFRQDYGQGDINDIILYARVLLMNNLADDALNLLSAYTSNPEAGMLHLLAQLRRDIRSPRKVLQAGLRQMQGEWVQPELKIYLWSIVVEAARRSDDRLSAIKAMEFVLADTNSQKLPNGLFKLSIDDLWMAYIDNAIKIGNKAQYLMGDDVVWLNAAQAIDAVTPINARSLYAFLILRGQDKSVKKQAARLFLKSLLSNSLTNNNSSELVKQLFLKSKNFKSNNLIPVDVRHFLVDYLLRKGDIRLASGLMASIKTSPQGADKFMWSLRRARVLVMGGKAKESAQALMQLLNQHPQLKEEDIDKLMQVVFDLQTVNAQQYAYDVFNMILKYVNEIKYPDDTKRPNTIKRLDDIKLRREIYYWMADSKKAQKQYAAAASLYLKSAMLPEGEGLDPWGQTARYQAASNLVKAGLLEDARALYSQLLDTTREESRRKVLKRELQQLRLLENKATAIQ